jgi:hypothetical protein
MGVGSERVTMTARVPERSKPAVWSGIIGAAVIAIVGVSAEWVLASGFAEVMAEQVAWPRRGAL